MKKKLFLFLLISFTLSSGFAQSVLGKIKFTSVEFNNDSTLAVITQKKKMGLFDIKNQEFIVKPSKSIILPSFERNWYVVIGKKETNVYEHGTQTLKIASEYTNDVNGFSVKHLDEDRLLIHDYGFTMWDPDKFGDEFLVQTGHQQSGLYNIENNEWEIPAQYERIYEINDKYLCRKDDSIWVEQEFRDDGYPLSIETYETHYDLYSNLNEDVVLRTEIKENEAGLKAIFEDELYDIKGDNIILKKDENFGAMRFNLFQMSDRNYPYLDSASILKTEQKFIYFGSYERIMGFQSKDDSLHLLEFNLNLKSYNEIGHGDSKVEAKFKADWITESIMDEVFMSSASDFSFGELTQYKFGLERIDSNRIKVIDVQLALPGYALNEWGLEDLDEEGFPILDDNGAVNSQSGLFNKASLKWEVPTDYMDVICLGKDYYLVQVAGDFEYDNQTYFNLNSEWHLIDNEFTVITTAPSLADHWQDEGMLQILDGRGEDVLFIEGPTIKNYGGASRRPLHHYSTKDGRMKVFSELDEDDKFYSEFEADFIYKNQQFPYWVSLDNNKWTLHLYDTTFVLAKTDFPIELHHPKGGECHKVIQILSENDTTLLFEYEDNQACQTDVYPAILKLTSIGDSMIVINDVYREEYEKVDYYFEESFMAIEDYAGSAVWKKDEQGNWNLATHYYARLDVLQNGFLAKTRNFDGGFVYDQNGEGFAKYDENGFLVLEGVENERYLWLKPNLEARQFLDYYDFPLIEDLGFGMKVCTDKGCMLVTYSGMALTDDVWYDFRIENDMIIGTKLVPMEWGDEEEFEPVDVLFEIITVDDMNK